MKPFKSAAAMRAAHEAMFGDAGRQAAEIVLDLAPRLFAAPIDPLSVRVVLAPVEMGAYNKHTGYHIGEGSESFILGNRHECRFRGDDIALNDRQGFEDFIVHELTHRRQGQLLREHAGEWGWALHPGRGAHRDKGWYAAISEAAPNYLGVELPESVWPRRGNGATLTEPEMTHWPESIRALIKARDPRLAEPAKAEAA
jgi:hypothetical protein